MLEVQFVRIGAPSDQVKKIFSKKQIENFLHFNNLC